MRSWPRCRAAAADRRWQAGLLPQTASQRQPAGEQVGVDRTHGIQLIQPRGHSAGRLQQGRRTIPAFREPAEQQDQFRPRCPPRALLAAEQAQGFGAAILREAQVIGRGRGQGGGIQQLGALRRRAVVTLDRGHRHVDLAQGILGQAGREQHRALVDEQLGLEDPQLVEQGLRMVQVGERGREIATGMRRYAAFLAHHGVLHALAARGPQRLDPGVVPVSPLDITQGEIRRCPVVQRTCFPDQVASAGQQVYGGLRVPQSLGIAAQDPQGVGPADQDLAGRDAATALHQGVQNGQATSRLPGQNPGRAQAGQDIGLLIQVSGLAREPARIPELLDRFTDIAVVPQDHAGGLVRDRGLRRRRVLSQHLPERPRGLPMAAIAPGPAAHPPRPPERRAGRLTPIKRIQRVTFRRGHELIKGGTNVCR